jgi:parvulin-like peptidyl-prolyl isomerase
VLSGFGIHLVRVSERVDAALPPLADIRAEVAREWENDRRNKAIEAKYARLLQQYDVVIEGKP